jgi:hypothetical protein
MLVRERHNRLIDLRAINDEAAVIVQMLIQRATDVSVVEVFGTNVPAALYKAENHSRSRGTLFPPRSTIPVTMTDWIRASMLIGSTSIAMSLATGGTRGSQSFVTTTRPFRST